MTIILTIVSTLFVILELYTVFIVWFDRDLNITQGLAPGAFVVYKDKNNDERIQHLADFLSLWVGNNKLMMSLMLTVCVFSRDPNTRLGGAFISLMGCLCYFMTMYPLHFEMTLNGEIYNESSQVKPTSMLIGYFLIPLWIIAVISEAWNLWKTRNRTKQGEEGRPERSTTTNTMSASGDIADKKTT